MDDRLRTGVPKEILRSYDIQYFGGTPSYQNVNGYMGDFINLQQSEYLRLNFSGTDTPQTWSSFSYNFWFSYEGNSQIVSLRDTSNGFSMITDSNQLIFIFSGTSGSVIKNVVENQVYMATVTYDGTTIKVFIDGEEVFDSTAFTPYTDDFIMIGSNRAGAGLGKKTIGHFTGFDYVLSDQEIQDNFQLGSLGKVVLVVDAQSGLNISFDTTKEIQTAWQAYGIVTGKS